MNTNETKDYSLLRPFDLEAAKAGEAIMWLGERVEYLGLSPINTNRYGEHLIRVEHNGGLSYVVWEEIKMAPLVWVEGKPVYKGDVLWYSEMGFSIEVTGYNDYNPNNGLKGEVKEVTENNPCGYVGGELTWAPFNKWSWNKPKQKVKRKVFINIYPEGPNNFVSVYSSKELAERYAASDRIACVETEIEEYEI